MASDIDLCNRALAEIRARATIASLEEVSTEAQNCRLFYDSTRKQLLRSAHWGFARRQVPLSLLGTLVAGTSEYPWAYSYEYPARCIKMRYILPSPPVGSDSALVVPGSSWNPYLSPSRANRFLISSIDDDASASRVVLSNVKDAIGVFTSNVTNVDLFDPLFEEALVKALAAKLVIPLAGEVKMKADLESFAYNAVVSARVADGNEALPTTAHTPDWIAARNQDYGARFLDSQFALGEWYAGWDQLSWGE